MTPPTKRASLLLPARYSLFAILSLLVVSSSTTAIDLSRAFKNKDKDDSAAPSPSTTTTTANDDTAKPARDALADARKLIDDLNDAAMGTVTQPGREKEPATCDEILAKSLVMAKEEKAAVAAEKDAVVRAATLLSEKIDDLNALLDSARGEIAGLEQALASQAVEHESKMAEILADSERVKQEAEETISVEMEKFKMEMDVIKNATSTTIAAKERDVAERIAEAEQKVTSTEEYYKYLLTKAEHSANGKVASIIAKSEQDMAAVMKSTAKKIADAELEAQRKLDRMEMDMNDLTLAHKQDISNIHASHENEMKDMKEVMEMKVQHIHDEMDKAIANAEGKISAEREKNDKLADQLQQMVIEAANEQKSLLSNLEMTRISSIELEKVSNCSTSIY